MVFFVFEIESTFKDDEKAVFTVHKKYMLRIDKSEKGGWCVDRNETEKGRNEHYRSSQDSLEGRR